VLGHEIVHAAARHGAKAQERGTLLQAGMAAAQIGAAVGGADANIAGLLIQGAGVGAQMIQMKYGRDQELESDLYGMKYMKLAATIRGARSRCRKRSCDCRNKAPARRAGWTACSRRIRRRWNASHATSKRRRNSAGVATSAQSATPHASGRSWT